MSKGDITFSALIVMWFIIIMWATFYKKKGRIRTPEIPKFVLQGDDIQYMGYVIRVTKTDEDMYSYTIFFIDGSVYKTQGRYKDGEEAQTAGKNRLTEWDHERDSKQFRMRLITRRQG
jgi:hypothetical protein